MAWSPFGWPADCELPKPPPGVMRGKARGVTKSPKRVRRKNRRKP